MRSSHILPPRPRRHDVTPLVATAHLERATEAVVQGEEVVRLKQHVRKLRVRNALLAAFQPHFHGVSGDHGIDRKMLAYVSEEIQEVKRPEPIGVIDEDRAGAIGGMEVQEAFELATEPS